MKCWNCGGKLSRKGYTHVTKLAGLTVEDSSGSVLTCESCGEQSISTQEMGGYERRAARLVMVEAAGATGAAMKFARKALGLKQVELARILQRNEQQISRDENSDLLPMDLRLAMAELLDAAERGESLDRVGATKEKTLRVA